MTAILVVLLVAVLELWTVVAVAGQIGLGWTLLLLVATSLLGAVLTKREGLAVWRRAEAELAAGRAPTRQLLDGALVLVGGAVLLVPGFLLDVVGLLLLLPPVRAALRPLLLRAMQRRAARQGAHTVLIDSVTTNWGTTRGQRSPWGTVIGGSVVDVGSTEAEEPHAEVVDVEFDEPRSLQRPERPAS